MRVTGLKNQKLYSLKVSKFLIDWRREVSRPQARVKQFLYQYWKFHIVLEEMTVPGSRCRLDLVNLTRRIVVEVSPSGSHSFNKFFHRDRMRFGAAVQRDLDKHDWCLRNNFKYIELNDDDLENLSKELFADRGIEL